MGAHAIRALLGAGLAIGVTMLAACGGGDDPESTSHATASVAETTLGAGLLPPDAAEASASTLGAADLPPDAAATVASDALPPNT